jgi:hypothetical protein
MMIGESAKATARDDSSKPHVNFATAAHHAPPCIFHFVATEGDAS